MQLTGIELVLVKSWGNNTIFGGFDPAAGFYQTNFWELENNDTLIFSDLLRQGKLAFLGTHDLIAHIAGLDKQHLPQLKHDSQLVFDVLKDHIDARKTPSIAALILPYTIGVVLDDLAQPPSYGSKSHRAVLFELLKRFSQHEIPMHKPTLLKQFPTSFQEIIQVSRTRGIENKPVEIEAAVSKLVEEILNGISA